MNDWLDYKGSGSARAYAADGLMGDSNISHGLFGIQTKKDMQRKQKDADDRLENAKLLNETKRSIDKDYETFKTMSTKLTEDSKNITELVMKANNAKLEAPSRNYLRNNHRINEYEERYKAMRATAKKLVREFKSNYAEFTKMYEDLDRRIKSWNWLNQKYNPGEPDKWTMLRSLYQDPLRSAVFGGLDNE